MGKRLFWFAAGVGLAALVIVKGKEYYQRFTPKGVADQIAQTQASAGNWLASFVRDVAEAAAEREVELREATGLDG